MIEESYHLATASYAFFTCALIRLLPLKNLNRVNSNSFEYDMSFSYVVHRSEDEALPRSLLANVARAWALATEISIISNSAAEQSCVLIIGCDWRLASVSGGVRVAARARGFCKPKAFRRLAGTARFCISGKSPLAGRQDGPLYGAPPRPYPQWAIASCAKESGFLVGSIRVELDNCSQACVPYTELAITAVTTLLRVMIR